MFKRLGFKWFDVRNYLSFQSSPVKPISTHSRLNSSPFWDCISQLLPRSLPRTVLPWNVIFPLQSYFCLMSSLSYYVVCEVPVALVSCDIFVLSNLGELCFYHSYLSYTINIQHISLLARPSTDHSERASCVISPMIW